MICTNILYETPTPPLFYTSNLFAGISTELFVYETPPSSYFLERCPEFYTCSNCAGITNDFRKKFRPVMLPLIFFKELLVNSV